MATQRFVGSIRKFEMTRLEREEDRGSGSKITLNRDLTSAEKDKAPKVDGSAARTVSADPQQMTLMLFKDDDGKEVDHMIRCDVQQTANYGSGQMQYKCEALETFTRKDRDALASRLQRELFYQLEPAQKEMFDESHEFHDSTQIMIESQGKKVKGTMGDLKRIGKGGAA